jgi:hypothetical protein
MKQWRKEGKGLILRVNTNKNSHQGELGQQLMDLDGLGMKELVGDFTGRQLRATYIWGNEPVDGIWATSDLTVANACLMPVGFGVGNHQLFVIDFVTATLFGYGLQPIVCPALPHLNTKIEGCAHQYNATLKKNILRHHLLEWTVAAASSDKP